jgi:hypothetical protein
VEAAGIEPPQQYAENSSGSREGGAKSGALAAQNGPVDPDVSAVVEAWPTLPVIVRQNVLAMVRTAAR